MIKERLKEGWLHIRMIQELAGYPVSHVEATMDTMNGRLSSMDGVEVLERDIHKPKEVTKGVWSMFADVELLVKDFPTIVLILFDFMPSSIEILEPETIKVETRELAGSINDLVGKMHHLDATAKKFIGMAKRFERMLKEAGIDPKEEIKKVASADSD